MSLSKTSFCVFCHESPVKLFTCARCKTTQYCGNECQKSDYKDHKFFCRTIAGKARGHDSALYQEAVRTQSYLAYTKAKANFEKDLDKRNWKQLPLWFHHAAFCTYLNLGEVMKAEKIHDFMTEFQKNHFQVPFMLEGNMMVQMPYHQEFPLDYEARHFALMNLKWEVSFDKKEALNGIEDEIQRLFDEMSKKDFKFDPDLINKDLKEFFQRLLSYDHLPCTIWHVLYDFVNCDQM